MRLSTLIGAVLALSPLVMAQDRKVFAHWMLGLAEDSVWDAAIANAKAVGIDAFVLNAKAGVPNGLEALRKAYSAAELAGFGMLISFDMCCGRWEPATVAEWINTYKDSTAQVKVDGKPFHSTFEGFQWATEWPNVEALTGDLYIIPSWTYDGGANGLTTHLDKVDGAFNWNAWPERSGKKDIQGDLAYTNVLGNKAYMMGVSPWMYTYLPAIPNDPKNWLLESDTLWYDRWEQILDLNPEFVEIISWNDYGESHYIGDLSQGSIPQEMQHYVNDIPHTGWQAMLPYYIAAYKAGTRNVRVPNEGAVFWYRTTPKSVCSDGGTTCGNMSGISATECVEDAVFVVTMSNAPTTVRVSIGGQSVDFPVKAGIKLVKMPFEGRTGEVQVNINGKSGKGPRTIENACPAAGHANFNPVVGTAMQTSSI